MVAFARGGIAKNAKFAHFSKNRKNKMKRLFTPNLHAISTNFWGRDASPYPGHPVGRPTKNVEIACTLDVKNHSSFLNPIFRIW